MSTIIDSNTYDAPLAFQQPTSIWPTALKWGAIGGALSAVFTLISYNIGWMDIGDDGQPESSWIASLLSVIVFVALITLGLKAYRDTENGGFLNYGRGVLWSFAFGLVLGAIAGLFAILFYSVLAPDYLTEMRDIQVDLLEEQTTDDAQLEAAKSMMGMMMSPWVMGLGSLIFYLSISLFTGLIASAFLKRIPQ